jgi:hypothetical protein
LLLVHGGDNKLGVFDFTVTISVNIGEHGIDLIVVEFLTEELLVADLDFFLGEFTITIKIHSLEDFIDLFLLLLGEKLGSNESIGGLLKLGLSVEGLQVGES